MPRRSTMIGGRVTVQRRDQTVQAALAIAGGLGVVGILRRPANIPRAWKYGAGAIQSATELHGLLPALGPDYKVGLGFGSQGMTTMGEIHIGPHYPFNYGTTENLPVPTFGIGLTSVPNRSSRFIYEGKKNQSRGGQQVAMQTREARARKTMRGPSAKKKPRMVRRRGSRCPPGYRYDAKRRMCIQKT